jgi:hypothetical protein
MCWCGNECVGEVCRQCLLSMAPYVNCAKCGAEIRTGFVSIKGCCGDCYENDRRHELASYLEAV